jgi:hypothetical protein
LTACVNSRDLGDGNCIKVADQIAHKEGQNWQKETEAGAVDCNDKAEN